MKNKRSSTRISLEKGDFLPTLLLSPTLFIVLVVMIVPFFYGLYISLYAYKVGGRLDGETFVGLANYLRLFKDETLGKVTWNTLEFALLATSGDLFFGTLIAVLLTKVSRRRSDVLRAVYLIPLLISPLIVGLIWKFIFDPASGPFYYVLSLVHLGISQVPGLSSEKTAMLCVVVAHWWQVVPFVILVVSAGLTSIPADVYEAAYLDGASGLKLFFKITLPLLTGIYMVILVVSGVDTIKVFDLIYSLTSGGPSNSTMSLSIYAYRTAFKTNDMGYAMAISLFTMVLTMLLFGIPFIKYNIKRDEEG